MSLSWATHRARLGLIFAAVLAVTLAIAGLLTITSQAATARTTASSAFRWSGGAKPVIVLEHGAWADSSSWDRVIAILQREGFTVYAPPNPLRGLPSDSAYLHDFLTENPALAGKAVVLVGHSYGGAVISDAAVGDSAVKALVYVDAFIPVPGESIQDLLAARPGSCIGSPTGVFDAVPAPGAAATDPDLYLLPGKFPGCFASGLPASEAAVLAATQRPLAAIAAGQPSGPVAWKTVPSWAVIGTADQVIPPAELLAMANRAGSRITDVNAGHLSLISAPGTVARVIAQAARATS
jgi:pimeloyl-ACP methyl ester carboxylesterase